MTETFIILGLMGLNFYLIHRVYRLQSSNAHYRAEAAEWKKKYLANL